MAAKCKKCDPHEICEECPEWIFTLADLIMCMMGLFVILWVMKPSAEPKAGSAQSEDMMEVIAAIRSGFGHVPDASSSDPIDRWVIERLRLKLEGPGDGGETMREKKGPDGTDPEVTTIRQGQEAVVGGRILFEAGSAQLSAEGVRMLKGIVDLIRGHRNIVLVKGHTSLDDFPNGTTPENLMNLSIRRAQAAADLLVQSGVEPDILRVQGCSTFEPVLQRTYTPDAQIQNRRVEVEATTTLVRDRQDVKKSTGAINAEK